MSGGYGSPDLDGNDLLIKKLQELTRQVAELQRATGGGVSTGDLVLTGAATPRAGYVLANGASLVRTDQPALFAVYGTTFGAVDGTHFNVPSLTAPAPATGTLRYVVKL